MARLRSGVRDSGPWTLTMSTDDKPGNLPAIAPPKMVLPMFLQLGLGTPAGTNPSRHLPLDPLI
jgi:hypothetical protein